MLYQLHALREETQEKPTPKTPLIYTNKLNGVTMETWITMAMAGRERESGFKNRFCIIIDTTKETVTLYAIATYILCTFLNRVSSIFKFQNWFQKTL